MRATWIFLVGSSLDTRGEGMGEGIGEGDGEGAGEGSSIEIVSLVESGVVPFSSTTKPS
jgi:hypothetical protein